MGRGIMIAELDQPGERVHAVRELVLLGAQRVGECVDAVEFADQRLQLGAVAQSDHRAELAPLAE